VRLAPHHAHRSNVVFITTIKPSGRDNVNIEN
jgi:hypothetical protein